MYFYIISCHANILSAVSITKHIECVNLIIFRGYFEDDFCFIYFFQLIEADVATCLEVFIFLLNLRLDLNFKEKNVKILIKFIFILFMYRYCVNEIFQSIKLRTFLML